MEKGLGTCHLEKMGKDIPERGNSMCKGGKKVSDMFKDAVPSSIGRRGFGWARSVEWEERKLERDMGIPLEGLCARLRSLYFILQAEGNSGKSWEVMVARGGWFR